MSRTIVLDTGPLGLLTNPARTPEVLAINLWVDALIAAGHRVIVPAIADYEVRRELERANKRRGLARLDAFNTAEPDRYYSLSDEALRLAAKLWAQARQGGTPTADPRELDCDVLIAAQALTMGISEDDVVVATANISHLSLFVTADAWSKIVP